MSATYQATGRSPALSELRFCRMQVDDLADVFAIENDVYPHPWTRGNFLDSLYSGYECRVLRSGADEIVGYFLLMLAVDEAHLLNISVRRDLQGRGIGRMQLDHAAATAREKAMTSMLLEVRPSNPRAQAIYERYGFTQIGRRKGYYPADNGAREDAIVMRLPL